MSVEHYTQFRAPYREIQAKAINWHLIGLVLWLYNLNSRYLFFDQSHNLVPFAKNVMEKHNQCDYSYHNTAESKGDYPNIMVNSWGFLEPQLFTTVFG